MLGRSDNIHDTPPHLIVVNRLTDKHHQSWTGAASLAATPGEQHRWVKIKAFREKVLSTKHGARTAEPSGLPGARKPRWATTS